MDSYIGSSTGYGAVGLPAAGYESDPRRPRATARTDPIFSVGRVQYALPGPLAGLACASEVLLLSLSTRPPRLVRIDLAQPDKDEPIELPWPQQAQQGQRGAQKVSSVFLDPTGRHALAPTVNDDVFYYCDAFPSEQQTGRRRARLLSKLKGATVTAVAWHPNASPSKLATTREILVGTKDGRVIELWLDGELESSNRPFARSSHERYVKSLLQLPERQPIVGLHFHVWQTRSGQKKRAAIIAATSTRIYQYIATLGTTTDGDPLLEVFSQTYRDTLPKSLELPGESAHSELHFWSGARDAESTSSPHSIAWLAGPGIYHGQLSYSSQEPGDGVIESAQLLPFPARRASEGTDGRAKQTPVHEVPISLALSEFHLVLLYEEHVKVIRRLDDRVVHEEAVSLAAGEKLLRLAVDPVKRTYWLYSESSIYELSVNNEDRDIWAVHLQRQAYDTALKYARTREERDLVLGQKADSLFTQGRTVQAAEIYAQTTRSFEEVALKFISRDERDALRNYLHNKLARLRKNDYSQRTMLATWLVEVFLSKINHLEDAAAAETASQETENLQTERGLLEEDLREFLRTYRGDLDPKTTYTLIDSHGRPAVMLRYAELIGDFERIVAHHVAEEDWAAAIETLNKQEDAELVYRFAFVLLRNAARSTVEMLVRRPSLDPRRLLPALCATPARAEAIRYLDYAVTQLGNKDGAVHNALLTLLAADADEGPLLRFLATLPEDLGVSAAPLDLDRALRMCRSKGRILACIHLYSQMGFYESSVDLALEHNNLELAKVHADRPEDDHVLRKKLWLKIARHVIGDQHDIKTAVQFLEGTDLLEIEDIMPFFPDFVVIDDFREEVCGALEKYADQIERLRAEMADATQAAEAIKQDLADLSRRFVVVDASERCAVCSLALLTRQFYVFPCQHGFHADCLVSEVTQHVSPRVLRRLLDLQSQLAPTAGLANTSLPAAERNKLVEALTAPAQSLVLAGQGLDQVRKLIIPDALVGGIIRSSKVLSGRLVNGAADTAADASQRQRRTKVDALRQELDDLLAGSCVLCDLAVASVDRPFVMPGEDDI